MKRRSGELSEFIHFGWWVWADNSLKSADIILKSPHMFSVKGEDEVEKAKQEYEILCLRLHPKLLRFDGFGQENSARRSRHDCACQKSRKCNSSTKQVKAQVTGRAHKLKLLVVEQRFWWGAVQCHRKRRAWFVGSELRFFQNQSWVWWESALILSRVSVDFWQSHLRLWGKSQEILREISSWSCWARQGWGEFVWGAC